MTKLDPFSAQIVEMVRNMPDEAILELVRNQLGTMPEQDAGSNGSSGSSRRSSASKSRKSSRRSSKKKSGGRRTSADRQKALDAVERAVKSSKGLSASEIAKKTRIPQSRVSTLVRELKDDGRIHQGGDRRFARYAGDAKTAKSASEEARRTASGPIRKDRKKSKSRSKKKRSKRSKSKSRKKRR